MAYSIDQFNTLRQAILDKIEGDETTIQEAFFEQRSEFEGSPAAVIGVSQNEALYNSNEMDRMTFVFQVMVYIPLKSDTDAHEVEVNMGKAYWELLHMFNQRGCLDGIAGLENIIVEPIPSVWGFEERGEGIYRFAEINLRCVVFMSNRRQLGS